MALDALAIQQPWAHLILSGEKRIENRTWSPRLDRIGQLFCIHASKTLDPLFRWERFPTLARTREDYPHGGIVGVARLVDVVRMSRDPWFVGPYGFVLADVQSVPLIPLRGARGFFPVPPEIAQQIEDLLSSL